MRKFMWNATQLVHGGEPSFTPVQQWEMAAKDFRYQRLPGPLHVREMNVPNDMRSVVRMRMYQVTGVIE